MSMVSSNSVAHCMCPVWPDVVIKSSPILQTVNKKVATTVCIDRCAIFKIANIWATFEEKNYPQKRFKSRPIWSRCMHVWQSSELIITFIQTERGFGTRRRRRRRRQPFIRFNKKFFRSKIVLRFIFHPDPIYLPITLVAGRMTSLCLNYLQLIVQFLVLCYHGSVGNALALTHVTQAAL